MSVLAAGLSLLLTSAATASPGLSSGTLSNGLEYVLVEDRSRPEVAVTGCFRIGGRTETLEEKGLTHFVEHLIGRGGTASLPELEWRSVRSKMNFGGSTSQDGSCYSFQVPSGELPASLESYAEALFDVEITDAKVGQEREVVLQELSRGLAMPFGPAAHALWPIAFTRHPYRSMTIGREEVVRDVSTETLRTLHSERFTPNHLFLVVIGDLGPAATREQIESAFGGYSAGAPSFELNTPEPPQPHYREVFVSGPTEATRLLLGCKVPGVAHPDAAVLDVASQILAGGAGSRLAIALLESGAALSASAASSRARDPGLFTFQLEVPAGQERRVLTRFWEVLADLARHEPDDAEARRARRSIQFERALAQESLSRRAGALAEAELAGGYVLELHYDERIQGVTTADVSRVVARYLDPSRCNLVAGGANLEPAGWRDLADETAARWPQASVEADGASKISRMALANGSTVLLEERPGSPIQALELLLAGAPWNVPESLGGLVELAAQSLALQPVNGEETLEEFVASVGGRVLVRSTPDSIGIAIESLAEDSPELIGALAQAVASPRITPGLVDSARRRVQAAVASRSGRSENLVRSRLVRALFPGHPYGVQPLAESLDRIDTDRLSEFLEETLRGRRTILALAGGTDLGGARDLLAPLEGLPPGTSWRAPLAARYLAPAPGSIAISRDVPQSQVATGLPTVGARSDDFFPLQVAARVLWSRLFYTFVRGDEPLAYWLVADLEARLGPSLLTVQAGVSPDNAERLIEGIREAVATLAAEGITSEELKNAQDKTVGSFSTVSHADRARQRARQELLLGLGADFDEIERRIRQVTAEEVRRVAGRHLVPSDWLVSVVGPNPGQDGGSGDQSDPD